MEFLTFAFKYLGQKSMKRVGFQLSIVFLLLLQGCSVFQPRHQSLSPDAEFITLHDVAADNAVSAESDFALEFRRYSEEDDYSCKRPLFAAYFQKRYGKSKSQSECKDSVPFRLSSGIEGNRIAWLDPQRVKSIHVLFAGEGENIMSRFGHLSFRLIVCPKDDARDAACESNLYEHLVLGYRAHIDDFSISFLSGLFGGYRAHLYAHKFMDVYQEYAIGEFRELYSLPMKLSRAEINSMVRSLSDVHWSYAGNYEFLSNNCSSIAQKFLLSNWDEFAQQKQYSSIFWRPDTFFASIKESQLAMGDKLKDLKRAEKEGHFFPSTLPIYQRALDLVLQARETPEFDSLQQYSDWHPLKRRSAVLEDKHYVERLVRDERLFDAHMLLEELAMIRYERNLMSALVETIDKNGIETFKQALKYELGETEFQAFHRCVIQPLELQIKPTGLSQGIPNKLMLEASEVHNTRETVCSSDVSKNHITRVLEHLKAQNINGWQRTEKAIHFWVSSLENLNFYNNLRH